MLFRHWKCCLLWEARLGSAHVLRVGNLRRLVTLRAQPRFAVFVTACCLPLLEPVKRSIFFRSCPLRRKNGLQLKELESLVAHAMFSAKVMSARFGVNQGRTVSKSNSKV